MYKQKSKTSCLLDAAAFITKQSSKQVIEKFKYQNIPQKRLFSKHRYFRYSAALQTLRQGGVYPILKASGSVDDKFSTLQDEKVDMILGVNLADHDKPKYLHAVYYNGDKVWEPWERKFIGGLKDLKIVYAVVCYKSENWDNGINKNQYLPESIMWNWDMAYDPKRKMPEDFKMQYLKVL